jgi:DNA-directed RNA polymerase subunit K/omega
MDETELVELIAKKAKQHLDYYDAFPDVGMGMFRHTAIEIAFEEIVQEAARWNSMAALQLTLTPSIKAQADMLLRERQR